MTDGTRFSYLVCSERSGSNLVTKILDGHSAVCGPSPLHLLRIFAPIEHSYGDLADDGNWQALVYDVLHFFALKISTWESTFDADDLLRVSPRCLASLFRHVYTAEAARHGKTHVFVKENFAHRLLPYVQRHVPGAKWVWAVRDPRDMALSWKNDAVLRGGVVRAANVWLQDQRATLFLHRCLQAAEPMLLLRYEDLLADTAGQARRLCAHLGLDFDARMVDLRHAPSAAKNAAASVNWANLDKGVLTGNSGKYRSGLGRDEIAFVEHLCADEMAALGYVRDLPPLGQAEFAALQHRLTLQEPHDKPAYQRVGADEQARRQAWMQAVAQLQQRAAALR